ncbi:MAG: S9 family peptidase [Thermoanaerobaculia bacterium]|nr:S9 family peptidase [Thermoanaerobaculia bacterium]
MTLRRPASPGRAGSRLAAAALFALAPALAAAPPAIDLAASYDAFRRPADVAFSPEGSALAYTVWRPVTGDTESAFRGTIHVAAVDGGGERQVTPAELPARDPRWSPDGRAIAFRSDRSGRNQIWLVDAQGSEPRQLTDAAAPVKSFRWLPDGRALIYVAGSGPSPARLAADRAKDDARIFDGEIDNHRLWRLDLGGNGAAPRAGVALTTGELHVVADIELSYGFMLSGFDVAPDGSAIAFTHLPTARVDDWRFADLSLLDLATGGIRPLAATSRTEGAPRFSPDGAAIAFAASDEAPNHAFAARLHVVPAAGGAPRPLALTFDERPQLVGWSHDGREVVVAEVRGTAHRISALPVDGGAPRDLDDGTRVVWNPVLSPDRRAVAFVGERPDEAPQVFVGELAPWAPRPVSRLPSPLPPAALGRTEVVRWPGAGGFDVEGLLTYPVGYAPEHRVPLLVVIHGGPTWQFLGDYLGTPDAYPLAAFAARGFAILRPNPRGSSGRGRDFRYAVRGDWGGEDARDILAGVDHVVALGVADADRLGVMGWSYGGYMTNWLISQTRRFKAASSGAGIANLTSFTGTSDLLEFLPDYFGGPPWQRAELFQARSPLFQLAGAATPTLIQHGEADRRVPLGQSHELYQALKRLGVETELVIYPRQEHGIDEPKLLLDAARRNLAWFERHLLGPEN